MEPNSQLNVGQDINNNGGTFDIDLTAKVNVGRNFNNNGGSVNIKDFSQEQLIRLT